MHNIKLIFLEHKNNISQIFKLSKMNLVKMYKGAALGWLWAIIQPIITIFVYYFAFTFGLRTGKPVNGYPYIVWLITGMIPWFFIRSSVLYAASSIRTYRYLVTKIKFPISIITTFYNLSNFYVNIVMMGVVILIYLLCGYTPDIYWIQIPLFMIIMFVFFNLLSLILALMSALSLDFLQLVRATPIALFWLSGIMYSVYNVANDTLRAVLLLNPITAIINGFRNALIYKTWFWESPIEMISLVVLYLLMMLIIGRLYGRLRTNIADVL